ncbi:AEC family transporter [Kineobactrum salinum]|uniref:AEC family transporter n=2 Tax=Kineobactrum salinum TaxID=2708301 RepID=A0A6C0U664_9GAMM|nr:AEC family transporter [Kineobactrum salinum]
MLLRRIGLLPPALVEFISRLAFNVGLPLLLCISAAGLDFATIGSATYLLAGVVATLLTLVLGWIYARWRGFPQPVLGVFVQATFRSNLAIIGISLCHAAYGERGLALAVLPVAVLTTLYNVLAVWVLQTTLGSSRSFSGLLLALIRNPLLLGIGAGACVSLLDWSLPSWTATAATGLSVFFLPLILVSIGAAMRLRSLMRASTVTWEATAWRLCVGPLLTLLVALAMGVNGEPLGVLFLLISAPVAAASYVMVVALRGDGVLAANIIVLTTLLSVLSVALGFAVLVTLGMAGELA